MTRPERIDFLVATLTVAVFGALIFALVFA
jgi:hypothetical protein